MSKPSDPSFKEIVKTGYDSIAPAYLDFITKLPVPSLTWINKLLALLPSAAASQILELGCGPGIPCTEHLAQQVGIVIANDISSAQIDLAREKLSSYNNVSFMPGDMASLSFGESTFEAVTAFYSLQHLPREEQANMLGLIRGWLKPGGLLLCNFDQDDQPATIMDDWLGAKMFHSGFGVEGSKQLIIEAGFELVEAEVVSSVDGRRTVPFLWCLAKKN